VTTEFGQRFKEARLEAGLTQKKAAEVLGYTKSSIEKFEYGKITPPERWRESIISGLRKQTKCK